MLTVDFHTLDAFLQTNGGWAAGLAASMFGLTVLAGKLISQQLKDEIALWLMVEQSEQTWSRSFVSLFDAVFGERHLSLRCMLRSIIASLVAVAVIWFLMGNFGALELRVQAATSLGSVLVIALAVNVVADYVSLLETRLLLGHMHRLSSVFAQAAVLLVDLAISAAIIWLAIYAYLASPLHQGEVESFAEILGVFSIFSVIFYSTFLTSVWCWAYILSSWIMRLFARLRVPEWLDVEHKPILILGSVLTIVVFVGALALAVPMRKNADGLSAADRALCSVFKGRVCLDVAKLTTVEQAQLDFIMLACEGGVTEECFDRGHMAWELVEPETTARLWTAACSGGSALGCTNLGVLHGNGIGVDHDTTEAARLYRLGCEGGSARGCTGLGYLYSEGFGKEPADPREAARLYRMGCEGGDALGCTNLGYLHENGIGREPADLTEARRFYAKGCEGSDTLGCINLGAFYLQGIGADPDPAAAAQLFAWACELGDAQGCIVLGTLHLRGIGVDPDRAEAARLYAKSCDMGAKEACDLSVE